MNKYIVNYFLLHKMSCYNWTLEAQIQISNLIRFLFFITVSEPLLYSAATPVVAVFVTAALIIAALLVYRKLQRGESKCVLYQNIQLNLQILMMCMRIQRPLSVSFSSPIHLVVYSHSIISHFSDLSHRYRINRTVHP